MSKEAIAIALVNTKAAVIKKIEYPAFTKTSPWTVTALNEQDEEGYDLYQIARGRGATREVQTIPANRLLMITSFISTIVPEGTNEES